MSPLLKGASLLALMSGFAPAAAFADEGGRLILESRLRYENVDQAGLPNQADALTLRTRFGWEQPLPAQLRLLAEGENVLALVDRYADGVVPSPAIPSCPIPRRPS